jgi:hypothetical protein
MYILLCLDAHDQYQLSANSFVHTGAFRRELTGSIACFGDTNQLKLNKQTFYYNTLFFCQVII